MDDKMHILVVDDESGMRSAVVRTLQNYTVRLHDVNEEVSFDIEQATTAEEALEMIETSMPDIILLDHKLPHMSGLDVLEHLAEKEYDLLTVMMTAYASLETAISATKHGAYDFLAKPFTPEELKSSVYKAAKHLTLQRHARKLAQEKRQFRFQLISIVAHELKAPLAAIEQYLNILVDHSADEDEETCNDMIERSLIRLHGMRKLIMDLLDLTRIESGQKKREFADLDVREAARTAIDNIMADAEKRNITILLHADDPVKMRADTDEIEMVLNNLLSNAVKYNRDGGHVYVALESKDGRICINVTDNGIGMTQEEAAGLFNEFVRIKNKKTEDILGSGLGLSIVKKIALLYDGKVSVTSQPDVGSVFTVELADAQST